MPAATTSDRTRPSRTRFGRCEARTPAARWHFRGDGAQRSASLRIEIAESPPAGWLRARKRLSPQPPSGQPPSLLASMAPPDWGRQSASSTSLGLSQVRAKSVQQRETLQTNDNQRQTSAQVRAAFEAVTSTFAGT